MSVNKKLKTVMKDKGISAQDLCRSLKMDKSSVYYMLENDIFARPRKIAMALGVELEDIVG